MNILYLTNHLQPGGICSYIFYLSKAMRELGHKIIIASRGGERLKDINNIARHIKIPLKTKSEVSPKVYLSYFILRKVIKENKIDIIHANTRITQILAWLLKREFNIPFITTVHGAYKPKPIRRLFPAFGERIIAISKFVKNWLINKFKIDEGKIEVIYNGIDLKLFEIADAKLMRIRYNIPPEKIVIGNVARFSKIKGHLYLVKAFKKLLEENKNILLLLIGYGKEEKWIKEILIKENIPDNNYLIIRNPQDISNIIKIFDIFVMPSLEEGLGISIIEAMAGGRAIVASNVGGIPELIKDGENGILVPPADYLKLADAIQDLIKNSNKRNKLGLNAKISSVKFDYGDMAQLTLNLYKKILSDENN